MSVAYNPFDHPEPHIEPPGSAWWGRTLRMDYKRADGPTLPPRAVWGCYHPRHARQGMLVQRVA